MEEQIFFDEAPPIVETLSKNERCSSQVSEDAVVIEEEVAVERNQEHMERTITPEERERMKNIMYGDLDPRHRDGRANVELRFMRGKSSFSQDFVTQSGFVHPERTIPIGTNGRIALALQGENTDDKVPSPPAIEIHDHMSVAQKHAAVNTWFEQSAKNNDLIAYLMQLRDVERASVFKALYYMRKAAKDDDEKDALVTLVARIAELDPGLREAISAYGRKTNGMKDDPSSFTSARPGGAYPAIKYLEVPFASALQQQQQQQQNKGTDESRFYLLVCETPSKEKNKNKWKLSRVLIKTGFKQVPAVALNDTYAVVAYCAPEGGPLRVEIYNLATLCDRKLCRPLDTFLIHIPAPQFDSRGLLNVYLSKENIVSMSFSRGALVFDALRMVPNVHATFFDGPEGHPRLCMSASIVHPHRQETRPPRMVEEPEHHKWAGVMLMTSDAGECFGVDWRNGAVLFAEHVPGIEPIFSARYSNGRLICQTAMALAGRISNLSTFKNHINEINIDRPLGFDVCGTLIFILGKYGNLKIMSSLDMNEQRIREIKPWKGAKQRAPVFQPWYQAVHATHDGVVVLYPDGHVRWIKP
jgi:hypothetical protein